MDARRTRHPEEHQQDYAERFGEGIAVSRFALHEFRLRRRRFECPL